MTDPDPRLIDLRSFPFQPSRWKFTLHVLLVQNNFRHAVKNKGVSNATMAERRHFYFRTFDWLLHNDRCRYKLDPRSLSGRHVEFLFEEWERRAIAGELGASSLQKFHSFLSTFAAWIGKPGLVKPIGAYIQDASLYARTYVATRSKAWEPNGVTADDMIAEVTTFDERAAAQLALMQAFGLRFKEAVMVRPHVDVVTAAQAGRSANEAEFFMAIHRGTKGGRFRHVPVVSPEQVAALERAKRVVSKADESLSDPGYTLVRAIRHLRYVMERYGITKRCLGVTPHGLRHGFAARRYEDEVNSDAPALDDVGALRESDERARLVVSRELGHSRKQITSVYLSSSRATIEARRRDRR